MTYVITQNCCNDATCADVCPAACIHPTPDETGYASNEMLYIDPARCIDCGACAEACPVDAVYAADELPASLRAYSSINADYYRDDRPVPLPTPALPCPTRPTHRTPLRVAIVGAGPSGFYAAERLLSETDSAVQVSMFDRLPTPFGLVRAGVAPDHAHTKKITDVFSWTAARSNFRTFYNVEIGRHLSHAELARHHHAVIYTVGALSDRRLGIPGEDLPGSHAAAEFVAWYNGHPDYRDRRFDFGHRRAVVIGNGNVGLDIARILLLGVERLRHTDIADHALEQLAHSKIEEVVLLGRRGPAQAAYTTPELLAFAHLDDIDVLTDPVTRTGDDLNDTPARKSRALSEVLAANRGGTKQLTLRFLSAPTEILGTDRVERLRIAHNRMIEREGTPSAEPTGRIEDIETGLVLRAVGFRGQPIPEIPFDTRSGTIPNEHGRVLDPSTGQPQPGVYTAGWIKRGPSGVIGTNRTCAAETVDRLLEDFDSGRLTDPALSPRELTELLDTRQPHRIDRPQWQRIDEFERAAGRATGRPQVKLTSTDEMLTIAHERTADRG
ncbi:MAG: 4Fe-4S binding protein [Rhodococcus sp. (in: high G+C Gram-positive bacteria)]